MPEGDLACVGVGRGGILPASKQTAALGALKEEVRACNSCCETRGLGARGRGGRRRPGVGLVAGGGWGGPGRPQAPDPTLILFPPSQAWGRRRSCRPRAPSLRRRRRS